MTSDLDQKTYWGLLETVSWIRARDVKRVAAMWDMDEGERMTVAIFDMKPQLDPRSLLIFRGTNSNAGADREAAGPPAKWESSRLDASIMMGPDEALDDLLKKVKSRRVQMTAIRCDGSSDEQIQVPPTELNDLSFRLSPGHRVSSVGLWSRSRETWAWRSPQFLRAEVILVWPTRSTKTAAVSGAILRHLQQITTPEAPLTKLQAQQRCMAEVPNAYPEAFKKAWADLERSCKRGRGKHGPRAH